MRRNGSRDVAEPNGVVGRGRDQRADRRRWGSSESSSWNSSTTTTGRSFAMGIPFDHGADASRWW
jgi:hypothetical protein